MEESPSATPARLRAPLGFYPAKVDATGRMKLPAKFQDYLRQLPDKNLFVAEHKGLVRVFTNGSWERVLSQISDRALKKRFTIRAAAYGGDVDLDPQGRITLPQLLRKQMQLEDQPVQLRFYDDVITIYTQPQFEEELRRAESFRESDLERLDAMGIDL